MRGKGKKEAMVHVNLRLPMKVLAYYQQFPSYTVKMREVLTEAVDKHKGGGNEMG